MGRQQKRLHRQFAVLGRNVPGSRPLIDSLVAGRFRRLRIPVAILLILGGCLWFLPVLGLWMIPLGLLLLAVDVPALEPKVSAALIRSRRFLRQRRRRFRRS